METITEFKFIYEGPGAKEGIEIVKRVFCHNLDQAYEKLKCLYPQTYDFILIEKGRIFKNFDDFLENHNYYKTITQ